MDFNIVDIIMQVSSFVLGGGLASFVTIKQIKKKAELENNNIVEEGLRNWCHELTEDNESIRASLRELQKMVNDKDAQIGKLSHQLTIAQYACEQNIMLRCQKLYCKQREPKLDEQYITDTINMVTDNESEEEKKEREDMAEFEDEMRKKLDQPKQDNV